jgi:hypothetical protein
MRGRWLKAMTNAIQIKYNKSFIYLIFIFLFGLILIIDLSKHIVSISFIVLNIGLIILTLHIFFKLLLPAINNQTALELNNEGIYDFVRNQSTSWKDVTGITKIYFGRGQSGLGILLADKKQFISQRALFKRLLLKYNAFWYSTPFIILFSFLEGSNDDILKKLQNYHDDIKNYAKQFP